MNIKEEIYNCPGGRNPFVFRGEKSGGAGRKPNYSENLINACLSDALSIKRLQRDAIICQILHQTTKYIEKILNIPTYRYVKLLPKGIPKKLPLLNPSGA